MGRTPRSAAAPSPAHAWPALLPSLPLHGIAQGGEAVGRYQGRIVFVQGGLPGEVVSVHLLQTQSAYARGVVAEILSPAPERTEPRCPLFGRCGGCQWQHISYPAQLAFKRTILEDQCRHLGRIESPPVAPPLGMEDPWAYRSTAELHLSPEGRAGYYVWGSHTVVPLGQCPLLVPALNALLPPLQDALQEVAPAGRPSQVTLRASRAEKRCLALFQGGNEAAISLLRDRLAGAVPEMAWQRGRDVRTLAGRGFLCEALEPVSFRISPSAFFQVNVPQAQRLLQTVLATLDPRPQDRLLDAYAGVGALSLPLAPRVARVTAIESHPAAVEDLRQNAGRLGVEVEAIQGPVERVLPALQRTFDLAIVDPPRRGCRPAALEAIIRGQPRRIAYVSCHPGTLARDLRTLLAEGYCLRQIQPVDLFPQTFHVESVALLERTE